MLLFLGLVLEEEFIINSIRMKGFMFNIVDDLRILNYFKVQHRVCKNSTPVEISWSPSELGEIMICCDGASLGNQSQAGASVSFKDSNSRVLGALCVGLGWQTNFYAEVCAIIYGIILAKIFNVKKIYVHSDSMSCIQALQKGELHWQLTPKWKMAYAFYNNVRYVHSYREANFTTDALAKQAYLLVEDSYEFYEGRRMFILAVEWLGEVYYRFK
ncbi:uncharacterized protein LOC113272019 [Papaver somniferum]|uniref:uncharacterized protein LOC113272019 n=1 Tax=Papaver somniferum TaxID=3469 RepID=UPI000E700BAC|nr:uncharacterized protein LOC113272019 [Papaver somniferum]